MLAKANRITRGADYKATVRRGTRIAAPNTITYLRKSSEPGVVRFGFVVSKAIGGAVTRNRVRRRLKAACFELLPRVDRNVDVVVRALPASVDAPWATLLEEITRALSKGSIRT